jgi:hypothetical protein
MSIRFQFPRICVTAVQRARANLEQPRKVMKSVEHRHGNTATLKADTSPFLMLYCPFMLMKSAPHHHHRHRRAEAGRSPSYQAEG